MIIGENYVFVSTPKSGTHTFFHILQESWGGVQAQGGYHQTEVPEHLRSCFCFTSVRHPFDRFVSTWHILTRVPEYSSLFLPRVGAADFTSFARWASSLSNTEKLRGKGFQILMPQSAWLSDVRLDAVVRIENADAEFQLLPFVDRPQAVPQMLARKHEAWEDVRTDEAEDLLRTWLKPDFDMLPYSPDDPWLPLGNSLKRRQSV